MIDRAISVGLMIASLVNLIVWMLVYLRLTDAL